MLVKSRAETKHERQREQKTSQNAAVLGWHAGSGAIVSLEELVVVGGRVAISLIDMIPEIQTGMGCVWSRDTRRSDREGFVIYVPFDLRSPSFVSKASAKVLQPCARWPP